MRTRRILAGAACAAAALTFAQCGSGSSAPPTSPTPIPTIAPTPTPKPTGIVLPAGMVCSPAPPPIWEYKPTKWRPRGPGWMMDSQPVVKNVDHYCGLTGQGDYDHCYTRDEMDPQRQACDYLMTGQAKDTGRWGPTWTVDGFPCDGTHACANNENNQFQAIAKDAGLFQACASDLVPVYDGGDRCGAVFVDITK